MYKFLKRNRMQNKSEEIEFFTKILSKNDHYDTWNETFYNKLYNYFDIANINNVRILEAGCGTGVFGRHLFRNCLNISLVGVDITPQMIFINKKENRNNKFCYLVGDLENVNLFQKNHFDIILCPLILHHFPDLKKVIRNFKVWLKPEGRILIIEPNGYNIYYNIGKMFKSIRYFGNKFSQSGKSSLNETNHTIDQYHDYFKMYDFSLSKKVLYYYLSFDFPKREEMLLYGLLLTRYFASKFLDTFLNNRLSAKLVIFEVNSK